MISDYAHVRIKATGITGIVVDISEKGGRPIYTIESDERDAPGGFGVAGYWRLFICAEDELELVDPE